MHSWRRVLCGLVLLFGLVVFAPSVYGQGSVPLEGKGSVAGNSGAFTYSIPIEVPPGRHGLTPQLALTYNSSGGNGLAGVGWDLPVGYVMRNTKYGVSYNCNPTMSTNPCYVFMLGGTSGELIPRPDMCSNCYGARIEGAFIRFRLLPGDTWEATDKKGTKYLFGETHNSILYTSVAGQLRLFRWGLTSIVDTNSNTIVFTYFKDGTKNETYLQSINYQANHLVFNLALRTDALLSYTPTEVTPKNWTGGLVTKYDPVQERGIRCNGEDLHRNLRAKSS